MARAKFKVENLREFTEGSSTIKKIQADLVPVAGDPTDETITMSMSGSNPTIVVTANLPHASTVLEAGKIYNVTFDEVP